MSSKSKRNSRHLAPYPTPTPPTSAISVNATTTHLERWTGPVPPPEELAKFNNISPGLAERLVTEAEAEAKHRRMLEENEARHVQALQQSHLQAMIADGSKNREETRLGQFLGFSIGTLAILCGTGAVLLGHDTAGAVIGGTGVAGIVSVFVMGRRPRDKTEGKEKIPNQ